MLKAIIRSAAAVAVTFLTLAPAAKAQPAAAARPAQPPQVVSPEVSDDRKVTYRLYAPKAEAVKLVGNDMAAIGNGKDMTKGENGIWEVTVGPANPGAYRYMFQINGVSTLDPRNPVISESNNNPWSMVYVPGSEYSDTKEVPHGAVSEVTYYSASLKKFRRMHVYTPPGYELGKGKFPVFYLLHGASDSDDSWTSVGRAGFILDNLLAAGKAKPMIVVMPHGHTRLTMQRMAPPAPGAAPPPDEFLQDFEGDIMPYVAKHYRILSGRANTAIAGLSMGGNQTLGIAFAHLERFAYVGVFSSGLFTEFPTQRAGGPPAQPRQGPSWQEQHAKALDDAKLKQGLKLFWFGTGKEDFLLETSRKTVEMFKNRGFKVEYDETEGPHTWWVWRGYLNGFAPRLFR